MRCENKINMWILQIISPQMCFCLRASSHGNGNFYFSLERPSIGTRNLIFSCKRPLGWHECELIWVTIDLIDIGIQRLRRIKSGLQRDLRKAKAAIFCKLYFFCYICNAFSHAAHGLCLRDGRKQPHNEQKSQLK